MDSSRVWLGPGCEYWMGSGYPERRSIPCAPGRVPGRLQIFRANLSGKCGKTVPETENPGRARILQRIQSALREPSRPRHAYPGGQIFTPVQNPRERFQQACKNNKTEFRL